MEKILQEQFLRAKRIIEERRADVETLTGVLLQAGRLSGQEIEALTNSLDVQSRRGSIL